MDPTAAPGATGGLLAALVAPWLGVAAPGRASRRLALASVPQLVLATLLHTVVIALTVWGCVYAAYGGVIYVLFPVPNQFSVAPQFVPQTPLLTPDLAAGLITIPGVLANVPILALCLLPYLHRAGPIAPAFRRAVAAVVASLGAAEICIAVVGVGAANAGGPGRQEFWLAIGIPLTFLIVTLWQQIATNRLARSGPPPPQRVPRFCITCGYDLTSRGGQELCPECGMAVASSLARRTRPGSRWQRARPAYAASAWLADLASVLLAPSAFYRRAWVRHALPAAERWQWVTWGAILVSAFVAIALLTHWPGFAPLAASELWLVVAAAAAWCTAVSWGSHRLAGLLAFVAWTHFRLLPDLRWGAQVLHYESAFLWLPCIWGGLLAFSFVVWDNWMSSIDLYQASYRMFGIPPEPAVLLGGWIVLGLYWIVRWTRITAAIRWANF